MKYHIVDVFCTQKYSGNQLAVVHAENPLTDSKMQAIAAEFHFSETTFISGFNEQDNSHSVRIFTPQNEVPFAGHPVLGTAAVILNKAKNNEQKQIILNLKAGKIPVTYDKTSDIFWMRQLAPIFGPVHDPALIAPIINLSTQDIDSKFPIQEVSTGLNFLIIPVKTRNAIKKASTNLNAYRQYFHQAPSLPVFLFCSEPYEATHNLNCRMFADIFGIPEDPATGSANGCLAAYLTKHKYLGSEKIDISVEQGYEIERRSILYLRAEATKNTFIIDVGGRVISVAEGILL